jgi:hypothetical protein
MRDEFESYKHAARQRARIAQFLSRRKQLWFCRVRVAAVRVGKVADTLCRADSAVGNLN